MTATTARDDVRLLAPRARTLHGQDTPAAMSGVVPDSTPVHASVTAALPAPYAAQAPIDLAIGCGLMVSLLALGLSVRVLRQWRTRPENDRGEGPSERGFYGRR